MHGGQNIPARAEPLILRVQVYDLVRLSFTHQLKEGELRPLLL
jgi:hypothetical protein